MKNLKYSGIPILVSILLSILSVELKGQVISDTANTSLHYVLPEFVEGYVKLKNGTKEFAVMNYNQLTEEMIFNKDRVMLALDSLIYIDTVNVDSRLFIPHDKVFFEVLVKGKVSLYMQHKCNLLAAGNPSGYGGVTETGASRNITSINGTRDFKLHLPRDFHITDASQFWISKGGIFHKANTVSQIAGVFPEKKAEIKNYVKTNKLDLDKPEDRVTLIVKCNELIK